MRPFTRSVLAATLWLTAWGMALPANAQVDSREGIALQNQIYQLRQQLQALSDQGARGGASRQPEYSQPAPAYGGGSDILTQLLTRVDALEDQVRRLRGRVDETQNQLQRQDADLNKRIDDLAFQLNPQAGGSQGNGPPGGPQGFAPQVGANPYGVPSDDPQSTDYQQAGPPNQRGGPPSGASVAANQAARPPRASPGPRTPEVALQQGNAALARHDYQAAEAAARDVLANRTSPRAYDAQILLAQALLGQRQYAQSAIAFDDAYNRSRKGTHAQEALVGLATSLSAINEKKAACDTLTRLRTEFPQPRPEVRDSAATTAQKAGCH